VDLAKSSNASDKSPPGHTPPPRDSFSQGPISTTPETHSRSHKRTQRLIRGFIGGLKDSYVVTEADSETHSRFDRRTQHLRAMHASHVLPERVAPRVDAPAHVAHVLARMFVHGALVAPPQPVEGEGSPAVLAPEAAPRTDLIVCAYSILFSRR